MKKIILTLVFLFVAQFNYASENDSLLLNEARKASLNKNYPLAIKEYKKYIHSSGTKDLKDVYLEIANCYFYNNEKGKAIKYIKQAIMKYGLTEDAFIYSPILDQELSKFALSVLYDDLDKMQRKYLATLD
jgi:tetratricopeptide (TPR) repeat protein